MLIRFEVANFRSILDPVELSMVAVDEDRAEARRVSNLGHSLLPVAAVYGPNASGKSNLVAGLTWLCRAIRSSLRVWDDHIPVEPFVFNGAGTRPSELTVEFVIDGVRFEYVLELDRDRVHYEALFHYPEKKRRRVFEREAEELLLQRGLGRLSGTRELLTPRTLALSVARRFDEPIVSQFARQILATQTLGLQVRWRRSWFSEMTASTDYWFEDVDKRDSMPERSEGDAEKDRAQALALLRLADVGIDDVTIDDQEIVRADSGGQNRTRSRRRLRLLHRTSGGLKPLDFAEESEGTRTWYELIGPVLKALRSGTLLLFDELDGSLHPTLSAELIRLFHDPLTNPHGAQLVFTSHDTSLLNHLNRDEVWLTEKDDRGATLLGALAEFTGARVRRSQNIERGYLHGRFGALPDVGRTDLLRALGLIG